MEEVTLEGSEPLYCRHSSRGQMVCVGKLLHKLTQPAGPMWCCGGFSLVQIKSRPTLFGEGLHKMNNQRSNYVDFYDPSF